MSEFIRLTDVGSDRSIFINTNRIVTVEPINDGTQVRTDVSHCHVKENYKDVMNLIQNSQTKKKEK